MKCKSIIEIEKELRKGKYEKKGPFVPVRNTNRDKGAPPFVPDWHSRLGNRDNSGFPTGTNQRFCSSVSLSRAGHPAMSCHQLDRSTAVRNLASNYSLIRFIRFVSRFTDKLCNAFFISSRFKSRVPEFFLKF